LTIENLLYSNKILSGNKLKMANSVKNLGSKIKRDGTFDIHLENIGD